MLKFTLYIYFKNVSDKLFFKSCMNLTHVILNGNTIHGSFNLKLIPQDNDDIAFKSTSINDFKDKILCLFSLKDAENVEEINNDNIFEKLIDILNSTDGNIIIEHEHDKYYDYKKEILFEYKNLAHFRITLNTHIILKNFYYKIDIELLSTKFVNLYNTFKCTDRWFSSTSINDFNSKMNTLLTNLDKLNDDPDFDTEQLYYCRINHKQDYFDKKYSNIFLNPFTEKFTNLKIPYYYCNNLDDILYSEKYKLIGCKKYANDDENKYYYYVLSIDKCLFAVDIKIEPMQNMIKYTIYINTFYDIKNSTQKFKDLLLQPYETFDDFFDALTKIKNSVF